MPVHSLSLRSWQLQLPKGGEKAEDCEDASATDPERGRFAVADGAAGSSFSALWARLLVEEFVRGRKPQPAPWGDWLPAVQQRWSEAVAGRAGNQAAPWYVEDRLQQGAFAAFLGLVLDEVNTWRGGRRWRWRAVAIGDCCLFQVRDGRLIQAGPLVRSKDFGNTPWLVGSRSLLDKTLTKKTTQQKGDWQPHDRFWLMTDALALWCWQQIETGYKPWKELDRLFLAADPHRAFAEWIHGLRQERQMRNDDVTLVAVGW